MKKVPICAKSLGALDKLKIVFDTPKDLVSSEGSAVWTFEDAPFTHTTDRKNSKRSLFGSENTAKMKKVPICAKSLGALDKLKIVFDTQQT